jgi:hypothetical protein
MKITVPKIRTNEEEDFPFIEALVYFWDDEASPHFGAEVTVFLDKADITISELKNQAIRKALDFLRRIAAAH